MARFQATHGGMSPFEWSQTPQGQTEREAAVSRVAPNFAPAPNSGFAPPGQQVPTSPPGYYYDSKTLAENTAAAMNMQVFGGRQGMIVTQIAPGAYAIEQNPALHMDSATAERMSWVMGRALAGYRNVPQLQDATYERSGYGYIIREHEPSNLSSSESGEWQVTFGDKPGVWVPVSKMADTGYTKPFTFTTTTTGSNPSSAYPGLLARHQNLIDIAARTHAPADVERANTAIALQKGADALQDLQQWYPKQSISTPAPAPAPAVPASSSPDWISPYISSAKDVLTGATKAKLHSEGWTFLGEARPTTWAGQQLYQHAYSVQMFENLVSKIYSPLNLIESSLSLAGSGIEALNLPGTAALGVIQKAEMKFKGIPESTEENAALAAATRYDIGGLTEAPTIMGYYVFGGAGSGTVKLMGISGRFATAAGGGITSMGGMTAVANVAAGRPVSQNVLENAALGGAFGLAGGVLPRPEVAWGRYSVEGVRRGEPTGVNTEYVYGSAGARILGKEYPGVTLRVESNRVPGVSVDFGTPNFRPRGVASYPLPYTPYERAIFEPNINRAANYLSRHSQGYYYGASRPIPSTAAAPAAEQIARAEMVKASQESRSPEQGELFQAFAYSTVKNPRGPGPLGFKAVPVRLQAGTEMLDYVYSSGEMNPPFSMRQVIEEMPFVKDLGPESVGISMENLKREGGVLGGSTSLKKQMGYAQIGEPHDFDYTLKGGTAEAEAAAKRIAESYENENVRVSPEKPKLVELFVRGEKGEPGKWVHFWDIHAENELPEPGEASASKFGYFGWGKESKVPRTDEGFLLVRRTELGGRSWSSAETPYAFGLATETHRMKDIFRGLQNTEYTAANEGREDILRTAERYRRTVPLSVQEAYEPWQNNEPELLIDFSRQRAGVRPGDIMRAFLRQPTRSASEEVSRARSPGRQESPGISAARSPGRASVKASLGGSRGSLGSRSPFRRPSPGSILRSISSLPGSPGSPSGSGGGSPGSPGSPSGSGSRSPSGSPGSSPSGNYYPSPYSPRRRIPKSDNLNPMATSRLAHLMSHRSALKVGGSRYIYVDLLSAAVSQAKYGKATTPNLAERPDLWATEGGLTPSVEQLEHRPVTNRAHHILRAPAKKFSLF